MYVIRTKPRYSTSMAIRHVSFRACCLSQLVAPFPSPLRSPNVEWTRQVWRYRKVLNLQNLEHMQPYQTVPRTTLWNRAHGRSSKEDKAKSQQYLTLSEEKALVEYLLRMSRNGFPVKRESC